jgi:dsDNA-specific endonuclease/ATPase MutS2
VVLGGCEPIFDITVSAAKKATISRLTQNEIAKECYQLGFFTPGNADAAMVALEMMDFDGIDKIRALVQRNGGVCQELQQKLQQTEQQLQQAQQQLQQMAQIIDLQSGGKTDLSAELAAAEQASAGAQMTMRK